MELGALARGTLHPSCTLGSFMGAAGGGASDRAAFRADPSTHWSRTRCHDGMEGLAASGWRFDSLRDSCGSRRISAAAVFHAEDREGAYLGVDPRADRARDCVAVDVMWQKIHTLDTSWMLLDPQQT